MAYFLDLFSPETYEAFSRSSRDVSGFRVRQQGAASQVHMGDKLICYVTKLSRWVGVLVVRSASYEDETPLFYPEKDPFTIRFKVEPLAWLPKEKTIPIREDKVWNTLSFTAGHDKNSSSWTGKLRSSLRQMDEADGKFLEQLILGQAGDGRTYPIDEREYKRLITHRVRGPGGSVSVAVPEDSAEEAELVRPSHHEVRESIKIQALLARIGATMGMKIWIPKADRAAVFAEWSDEDRPVLETLPLNYDETTLRTIEQIDVLWLKRRSIVRAFEVEHTTSVYSGILRMADLLALQPNMDIKLHIVAPASRREKVFEELRRPVFSLLEKGPLYQFCTYLPYESVREIAEEKHLAHISHDVLDEYAEEAE